MEQSTKRIEEDASVHLPPPGIDCSHLRRQKKLIHHFSHCDPQEAIHDGNILFFSSASIAWSDTRSVTNESTPKTKEAKKFEFESWPQGSKFSSWNVPFRRKVTTGSTHPRLIHELSTEIHVTAAMEKLDQSGFIFDKHHIEFGILDATIAKGIMKIMPAKFKRGFISWRSLRADKLFFKYVCSSTSIRFRSTR